MYYLEVLFTLYQILTAGVLAWPEGTYGLPEAENGCPHSQGFTWLTGYRIQKTEAGSHVSDNSHFSGMKATSSNPENKVMQSFCMKTSYPAEGGYKWEPGKYCIFKKGPCPSGFADGWIQWDDDGVFLIPSIEQEVSGVVPDGDFGRNTKVYFCCRSDGTQSQYIHLPTSAPFYLFPLEGSCQMVAGMDFTEDWMYWREQTTLNVNGDKNPHPRMLRQYHPYVSTKVFYCYYTKAGRSQTIKTFIIAAYVIGGVVAAIIALIICLYIIQRCCLCCKRYERPHNAESGHGLRPVVPAKPIAAPSAPPTEGPGEPHELVQLIPPSYADHSCKPPSYEEVIAKGSITSLVRGGTL